MKPLRARRKAPPQRPADGQARCPEQAPPPRATGPAAGARRTVLLVGNPNVGKSVVFRHLTGRYVTVSNYPGTTVEVARGHARGRDALVVDAPGARTLLPLSEDERATRDLLLGAGDGATVVQVLDARNLARGLCLTLELADLGLPLVVAVNMADEARAAGIEVDVAALSRALGVPVVETVAVQGRGMGALARAIDGARRPAVRTQCPPEVESAAADVAERLSDVDRLDRRGVALLLLASDGGGSAVVPLPLSRAARERLDRVRSRLSVTYPQGLAAALHRSRLRQAEAVAAAVIRSYEVRVGGLRRRLGDLAMHPLWGLVGLAVVLVAMYELVGRFGAGVAVDFLEREVFGRGVNPLAVRFFDLLCPFPHRHVLAGGVASTAYVMLGHAGPGAAAARVVHDLFVGEYGVVTMALTYAVAIVLPIVGTFFFAFGVLEDCGYLPRLAVMANRAFRVIGLNGKAVLPMVLGLGCDTMATLTARILPTARERTIVTLLLALGVPCSAQLGVILGMLGALSWKAVVCWGGVVLGVLVAVGTLAARVIPGEGSDFVLEIPPLRRPLLTNLLLKTVARIEWFLREAVPLFVAGTLVLFVLSELGLLGVIEAAAAPVVEGFLGLPRAATPAFVLGFLRRDYGAAGLFALFSSGQLDPRQAVVSLVVITLFVPCVANFLMIIKERGLRTALAMAAFIVPVSVLTGGIVRWLLDVVNVQF